MINRCMDMPGSKSISKIAKITNIRKIIGSDLAEVTYTLATITN